MDSEGAFAMMPFEGALRDQPAFHMRVFRVIRGEWNRLQNEKLKANATS